MVNTPSTRKADLTELSDAELVEEYRKGKNDLAFEVLIGRYKGSILARARTYFLRGADREDLIQEGMIGLIKAIRDYKSDRTSAFKAFAELCITRQIITAIKTASRQKHIPLNSYVSLYRSDTDGEDDRMLIDLIESDSSFDPEEYMIINESYQGIDAKLLGLLSKFERSVLENYISGKSYMEISQLIGRPVKSIDNALQRIKRKLERCYAKAQGKR